MQKILESSASDLARVLRQVSENYKDIKPTVDYNSNPEFTISFQCLVNYIKRHIIDKYPEYAKEKIEKNHKILQKLILDIFTDNINPKLNIIEPVKTFIQSLNEESFNTVYTEINNYVK